MKTTKQLSSQESANLIATLEQRFIKNPKRHPKTDWQKVKSALDANPEKLWTISEMERTGGEPDVVALAGLEIIFADCSPESPSGRRSVCYDREALDSRKENKPLNSAIDMAEEIGIEILTEEQYFKLQEFGPFDLKTSSWLKTPDEIRKNGGAIFGDSRYGRTFIYHNGVQSYYAARGFRGSIRL